MASVTPLSLRFWRLVDKRGTDECWPWMGSRMKRPGGHYGTVKVTRRTTKAHRVAYELTNGPIPEGLLVLHSCDNPPCCNPAHLRVGTHLDNNREAAAKGHTHRPIGELAASHKITAADSIAIRDLYRTGLFTQTQLATRFHLTQSAVFLIIQGRTWRHTLPPNYEPPVLDRYRFHWSERVR